MPRAELLSQAEERWQALLGERPDLAPAIALQRALVTRSLDLAAQVDASFAPRPPRSSAALVARLAAGHPVVVDEPPEFDATRLAPFVLGFCDDLASGGAGGAALRVRTLLERGEIDIASLLSASLTRQQTAIRTKANHVGVAPDLLWLVAELSVGPIAHRLQRDTLADRRSSNAAVGAALAEWPHGYCPACSSWPALAESVDGTRHLRCSFCGAAWRPALYRCIYCDDATDAFLTAAADMQRAGRRLELCRTCGGYLKSVDVETLTPFELLPVTDLETNDLDVAAVERGYARPPMRDVGAPAPPCPETNTNQ